MVNDQLFSTFLTNNQKRIDSIRKELKVYPSGTLYVQEKTGHNYFIRGDYKNGRQICEGINSKPETIDALIRKQLLEAELDSRLKRQEAVLAIETKYPGYDLQDEIRKIQNKYHAITDDLIIRALSMGNSTWASEAYEQSDYKPEEKRQINSHGLRVRSKSEVIITEKYYEFDIDFHYEQILRIGNTSLIPDFTIRRSDGKIFIWEHEGLTNVKSYLDWQMKKMQLYTSVGIVPWDNLIITYDNADGIIDLRIVESEIKNKLLV